MFSSRNAVPRFCLIIYHLFYIRFPFAGRIVPVLGSGIDESRRILHDLMRLQWAKRPIQVRIKPQNALERISANGGGIPPLSPRDSAAPAEPACAIPERSPRGPAKHGMQLSALRANLLFSAPDPYESKLSTGMNPKTAGC